jgi:hypothetical protein
MTKQITVGTLFVTYCASIYAAAWWLGWLN